MTYQKPSKKSDSSSAERQKETITFRDVNWWVFAGVVAVIAVTALLSRSQRTLPDDLEGVPGEFESLDSGVVSQPLQWSRPPELAIDPENVDYVATLRLPGGDIVIDLFEEDAPITVNNFVFLANQGYYNGVTFHRVIADFMAQGGDPTGTGTGGPGYRFEDETDNGLLFDRPYLLAMANAGPDTNGSQFFITFAPTAQLNGVHTIFGEVIEGTGVVDAIPLRDPLTAGEPGMVMLAVEIEERPK